MQAVTLDSSLLGSLLPTATSISWAPLPHLLPPLPVTAICRGCVLPTAARDARPGQDWGRSAVGLDVLWPCDGWGSRTAPTEALTSDKQQTVISHASLVSWDAVGLPPSLARTRCEVALPQMGKLHKEEEGQWPLCAP